MPLVVFTINTAVDSITGTVAEGMERDGGFTLRHQFDMPPHEDTEYTLKGCYINVSGDGRTATRGENKQATVWVDVSFPNLTDEMIISKRHSRSIDPSDLHADSLALKKGFVLDDVGQIRFPITQFPVNGLASNDIIRQANTSTASKYEGRGTHMCDIPLGRMKLEDNEIVCKLTPRNSVGKTFTGVNVVGARLVRIRSIQVVLEYK
jgi:hypothetical protein